MHGALSREGRAAVGLTALVAAAGLDVGNSQVYLLWAALSGLLLGSMALRPFYSMRRAHVRVQVPRRATARPMARRASRPAPRAPAPRSRPRG